MRVLSIREALALTLMRQSIWNLDTLELLQMQLTELIPLKKKKYVERIAAKEFTRTKPPFDLFNLKQVDSVHQLLRNHLVYTLFELLLKSCNN